MININSQLLKIKKLYEKTILNDGRDGVHSLIKSKKLIDHIHEFVKYELVRHGVDANKIYPPIGKTKPEITMSGFLKRKDQDITVLSGKPCEEIIKSGPLIGKKDKISKNVMDSSISINIRSQLSSLSKNFDTLYERTFAESLNLHLRSPKLVMGEIYMVPLVAYDPEKIKNKIVGWKEWLPLKYIPAFQALNKRKTINDSEYKYEKVCLLVVDFRSDQPKIIKSIKPFLNAGLVSEEMSRNFSFSDLKIDKFVSDILSIYKKRHGSIKSIRSVNIS
jgi:hypothetical protein